MRPLSLPRQRSVCGQVRRTCDFFLSGPFLVAVSSSKVAYSSGRSQHLGYFHIRRPVYFRDPCRVPSRCRPIQAYINAVPSFSPAVIFTCRVGSLSRSCTAIIVFCRRLWRVPFNIRHFRGPCPMPRPFSLLRQHRYTAIRSVSSPFQSG